MADFIPPVILDIIANWESVKVATEGTVSSIHEIGAAGDTAGAKMSAFGTKVGDAFLLGAAGVGVAAVDLAFKYGESLDKMQLQTHLTDAQMAQLRGTILQISTATATNASQITEAYSQTTKAGLSLSQSQSAVTSAAMFANAEQGNLSDTLKAALNIYNMHIAGTKNVSQTLDIFTTAIKNSRLSADDLTTALSGRALSAFAAYHIDIKTATAFLAGFANQGMTGAKAQMALATGFASLAKPMYTAKGGLSSTAQVLQGYGVNAATIAREARQPGGMLTVLGQLNQAWQTNATATERASGEVSFFNQVFGASAGRAFYNMINQLPKLQELMKTMNSSSGSTKSAFETWLSTPGGTLANFKTTMENALIPLGQYLLPKATEAAKWATGVMQDLAQNKNGIGTVVSSIGGAILAGLAASKLAGVGIRIAEAFGVTLSEGLAEEIGADIAAGIITAFAIKKLVLDPATGALNQLNVFAHSGGGGSGSSNPDAMPKSPAGSGGYVSVFDLYNSTGQNQQITAAQKAALDAYFKEHHLAEYQTVELQGGGTERDSTKAFHDALQNFVQQDYNKNFTVTVNIK